MESIPKMPVPKLNDTLRKFLESVKPFVSEQCYDDTIHICKDFSRDNGIGEQLQKLLEEKASNTDYWLADWSMTYKYLQNRSPIPGRISPMLYFPTAKFETTYDWLNYSSKMIRSTLEFMDRLHQNRISSETFRDKWQLDMQQYRNIFGSCRIPRHDEDDIVTLSPSAKHIIVAYRNNFFAVPVYASSSGRTLSTEYILAQLTKIIKTECDAEYPIGILTTQRRDLFAFIYENLSKDEINMKSIESIQSSLFIVCLDKPTESIESNYFLAAVHQLLYGGGSKENSANRWFDKTLQFIINENGINGLTYEHTMSEGQPIANVGNFILAHLEDEYPNDDKKSVVYENPCLLHFNGSKDLERDMRLATNRIDQFALDVDIDVIHFIDYGKSFIKSKSLSPDSYIQMAFQLTFYRLYNKPTPIYETVSLRKFLLGRTEGVRCCSAKSIEFVRAMCSTNAEKIPQRLQLLKEAVNDHQKATTDAMNGLGIEKHLMALKLIGKENGIQTPRLFLCEGFLKSCNFKMDGSQIASSNETFMCVGPGIENRFSFCYNPRDEDIFFSLSILKSYSLDFNTKDVGKCLLDALWDMRYVLSE